MELPLTLLRLVLACVVCIMSLDSFSHDIINLFMLNSAMLFLYSFSYDLNANSQRVN